MANSRISYNQSPNFLLGQQLATLVAKVIQTQQLAQRLVNAMTAMIDWGGTPNYVDIETEFGLAAGQGAILWNLMTPLLTSLNAATVDTGKLDMGMNV